jgi:3-dehydroquinate synthetase
MKKQKFRAAKSIRNLSTTLSSSFRVEMKQRMTRLEVVSQREIRYATVHPEGYVFDENNTAIADAVGRRAALFVVDRNIDRLYGADIKSYLNVRVDCRDYVIVDPAESAKTWEQVERICGDAVRAGLPRDGVIVGVGGGVTLDLAGFAASIFRRGINYIRVPTSLIGLIDVGVGIKQGINFLDKKSILGAFYPAMVNINDSTFLSTLPSRHLSSGIAEIIKIAIVRDQYLFALLETHVDELLKDHFQNSSAALEIILRAEYLMMDELHDNLFETRLRRLADFGHSFSPLIETASRHAVNHGEAVAMDMLLSTAIAVVKGMCRRRNFDRVRNLVLAAGLPLSHEVCTLDRLLKSLTDVRAHRAGDLNLIVPVEIGKADFVQEVSPDELATALVYTIEGQELNGSIVSGPWGNASAVRAVA